MSLAKKYAKNFGKTVAASVLLIIFGVYPFSTLLVLYHYKAIKVNLYIFENVDIVGAIVNGINQLLEDFAKGIIDAIQSLIPQITPAGGLLLFEQVLWSFFQDWVGFILFEPHDLLFFAMGVLIFQSSFRGFLLKDYEKARQFLSFINTFNPLLEDFS